MEKLTQSELDEILEQHKTWLDTNGSRGTFADLSHKDLSYLDCRLSNLSRVDFSHSNLTGTKFLFSDFCGVNFYNSTLSGTIFTGSNLDSAKGIFSFCCESNKGVVWLHGDDIMVNIGCESHSLEHWLENYELIGIHNGYTKQQIRLYGNILNRLEEIVR